MDRQETRAATKDLIDRLAHQVPDKGEADFVRRSAWAGEPALALMELTAILADEQTPVTAEDREALRRLLVNLGESTEDVDRLHVDPGKA